ncbi:hypothetical protein VCHA44O286_50104 [Vibrio chagasii]|nr:hypothetical protein VCHA44O286_50104 [Vibrio chagasii]
MVSKGCAILIKLFNKDLLIKIYLIMIIGRGYVDNFSSQLTHIPTRMNMDMMDKQVVHIPTFK